MKKDLHRLYYRIQESTITHKEALCLVRDLKGHVVINLKEALFITEGKLREAAWYLLRYLPAANNSVQNTSLLAIKGEQSVSKLLSKETCCVDQKTINL